MPGASLSDADISINAFVGAGSNPGQPATGPNILHKLRSSREHLPFKIEELALANGVGTLTTAAFNVGRSKQIWVCTAFCTADDVIATSAHCLSRAKGSGLPTLDSITFRVHTLFPNTKKPGRILRGRDEQSTLKGVDDRNPHLAVYSGYEFKKLTIGAVADDWAFAKLRRPICRNRALPFLSMDDDELLDAGEDGRIFMIAYPLKGTQGRAHVSRGCRIYSRSDAEFPRNLRQTLRRNDAIVVHDCFSAGGSSGGPIFAETEDGTYVVAVNSGAITLKRLKIVTRIRKGKRYKRTHEISRKIYKSAVRPDGFLLGLERYESERLLNSLEEFKEVQLLLKRLSLYSGQIDGMLGPMTKRALLRYEEQAGLVPIGLPTQRLLTRLRGEIDPLDTVSSHTD